MPIEIPKKHLESIKKGLDKAKDLDSFFGQLSRAGIDVSNLQQENEAQKKKLTQYKRGLFPND